MQKKINRNAVNVMKAQQGTNSSSINEGRNYKDVKKALLQWVSDFSQK